MPIIDANMMTPPLSHQDMQTIAFAVWCLARREPEIGRSAVAWSIRNRMVSHGRGEPGSAGRICTEMLQAVAEPPVSISREPGLLGVRAYWRAYGVACLVWCDDIADPTGGANRFHRHDQVPAWAAEERPVALLGSYFFYYEPFRRSPVPPSPLPPNELPRPPIAL